MPARMLLQQSTRSYHCLAVADADNNAAAAAVAAAAAAQLCCVLLSRAGYKIKWSSCLVWCGVKISQAS